MSTVIVTGANGGIGRAVVKKLLSEGKHVSAVARNISSLEDDLYKRENCSLYECDFTDENSIANMVKNIVDENSGVGGYCHCAGFDKMSPLYMNKTSDIENLFRIHVFAPMLFCKLLSKKGYAANNCSIVIISSLSAHEGAAGHTAYAAAKGALEGFLPSAACEMAGKGIRINAVIPGIVKTKMSENWMKRLDAAQMSNLESGYPLGISEADDVADLICFLLSDKAKRITGQKFIIDGGHMCRKF